jgi:hypothetical protein
MPEAKIGPPVRAQGLATNLGCSCDVRAYPRDAQEMVFAVHLDSRRRAKTTTC